MHVRRIMLSHYVRGEQDCEAGCPDLPLSYLVVVADNVPPGLHHEPRRDAVGGQEVRRDLVRARLSALSGKCPHLRPEKKQKNAQTIKYQGMYYIMHSNERTKCLLFSNKRNNLTNFYSNKQTNKHTCIQTRTSAYSYIYSNENEKTPHQTNKAHETNEKTPHQTIKPRETNERSRRSKRTNM